MQLRGSLYFKFLIQSFYNDTMARFSEPTYDSRQNAGSSGTEVSDLRPASGYNVDLRYGDEDESAYARRADVPTISPGSWPERPSFTKDGDLSNKGRAEQYLKAAKTAGKFKISSDLNQYTNKGETPRMPSYTNATSFGPLFGAQETPSMGASGGRTGAVGYAGKPQPRSGKPYNFIDSFG